MTSQQTDHFSSTESARAAARAALAPRPGIAASPYWDKFVYYMRRGLPIATALLGALILLWPFLNDQEVSFTLSKEEVAPSDGRVSMTGLRYVGTDAVNRLFRVEAAAGTQDDPGTPRIRLDQIRAEMALREDMNASVSARTGLYHTEENTLSLAGGVELVTDNGYALSMNGADVDLKTHIAKGHGTIAGKSPVGSLQAGAVEILVDDAEGVFTSGVKLHITPKRPTG